MISNPVMLEICPGVKNPAERPFFILASRAFSSDIQRARVSVALMVLGIPDQVFAGICLVASDRA
jgi:hypothetical protein